VSGQTKPPMLPQPPATVPRTEAPALARGLARDAFGREIVPAQPAPDSDAGTTTTTPATRRETATDLIGRRAGALSDELDFPAFVASLVHGTFDAIVDSSIRQMESFADLVSAVAKPVDEFTREHVSINQARDWLIEQHPQDLALVREEDAVHVIARRQVDEDGDEVPRSPDWLADYGLVGQELTPELIEEQLVPQARERVGRNRLQTLATMVLLGMNRVVVKDGTIGARLRFRAAAADHTRVDYAASDDPNQESASMEWGVRGSRSYAAPRTMVSTVGVNVQSDSELKAELFGEVKINFASETVPLDRFVDDARRNVLERHARPRVSRGAPVAAPDQTGAAGVPVAAPVAAAPGASGPSAGSAPATPSPASASPVNAAPVNGTPAPVAAAPQPGGAAPGGQR
jgi:hypothetical protein